MAVRASTGQQAVGRVVPQLILDGLKPAEHVKVALTVCHPMQRKPTLFPPVRYAIDHGMRDDRRCIQQRERMTALVIELARCFEKERGFLISKCHPIVRCVLTQNGMVRHVPLQRELGFVCRALVGELCLHC